MNNHCYTEKITCAYLHTISKYGYPPDIRKTSAHIKEMAELGFSSIELEGIGKENIEYLFKNRSDIAEMLAAHQCSLPVLCIVLPDLSSVDQTKHSEALELFEVGCETAQYLGAPAVLDNGPLINFGRQDNTPIKRHYSQEHLMKSGLDEEFEWSAFWNNLITTYNQACSIAAKYNLAYHMHPCEGSLITNTDSFINFAAAVNCPNLLFNLDTANQYYFKDNLVLSLLRLADRINYIHFSDNKGYRVEHLVPGDGYINWELFFSTLQKINFKGHFAIDVGGDETGIVNIEEAYKRSATWLQEQINKYSLNN
jgi:sugar phosphate isomerase/epimerase